MPRRTARGLASPMIHAAEAFRRKRVVDEARDGGAVLRAGEAVRKAPILQGVRRRPAARLDIGEDLDRRGEAGSRRHQPGMPAKRMRAA